MLKKALKDDVGDNLILSNPFGNVKPPKIVPTEIAYLDKTQTAILLRAASDNEIYPIIFLTVTVGMRRGELLALRGSDVNLTEEWIKVRLSLEQVGGNLSFKEPKSKSARRRITI